MVITVLGHFTSAHHDFERSRQAGSRTVAERELATLGFSMLTLRRPRGQSMTAAVDTLRLAHPDAVVDYNHVCRFDGAADVQRVDRLRIGIIDSAVSI